jgi:hypothetical protein
MLVDIFVTIPSLLMTTIAWYFHVGLVLICLTVLFVVAIGAISVYRVREDDPFLSHRPRPKLVPGA